jgi:hypothetical protein
MACAKLAAAVNDPYDKAVLVNMAEAWLRLADYLERKQNEAGGNISARAVPLTRT